MKIIYLLLLSSFLFACNANHENHLKDQVADSASARLHVNAVLDSMHEAFKFKKLNTMTSFFANEGRFLGTDPAELWSKQQITDYLYIHNKDTAAMKYSVTYREILLDSPGYKNALVVEQYFLPMSDKVMIRSISRLKETEGKWLINFYSWNLIPKNEDVDKINKAL